MMPAWAGARGPDGDVVFSTRMRLARNLAVAPFPGSAAPEDLRRVADMVRACFDQDQEFSEFFLLDMAELDAMARRTLVERHVISARLAEETENRLAVLSPTGTLAVMVNEEDHLRLQCFLPGRDVKEAWKILDRLDDWLSNCLPWCFSPRYGYLTTHLANLGTGMRASAMLHLPALGLVEKRAEVLRAAASLGVAVRGLYGEGSDSAGDVFQVSNRYALGPSEEEIVARVDSAVRFFVRAERDARRQLCEADTEYLADAAYRAYGILRFARRISTREALELLSQLKLGLDLKLVNGIDRRIVSQLFLVVRPASLQAVTGKTLDASHRDRARAELIRDHLAAE